MALRRKMTVGLAAVGAAAAVAGGFGIAEAATGSATPTPKPSASAGPTRQQALQDFLNRLAAKLGVSPDRVTAAAMSAADDMVDQAVKDGKITAAQAQKIKQAIASGNFGPGLFGGIGGIGGRGGVLHGAADVVHAAAQALGMTDADVRSGLGSGKTITDLATSHGKKPAAVQAALRTAIRKGLQPAVDAGKLTAARADQMADSLAQRAMTSTRGNLRGDGFRRGWFGGGSGSGSSTNAV
jgi:anti-sigma28 factor (negative regulator of flagellin synthesis)